MVVARALVLAGSLAYVVGGWLGWFGQGFPEAPTVRAHELAGAVEEWMWLGART